MEWILGIIGAVIVSYFTARFAAKQERERLREELKLENSIEAAIIQLLDKQNWELRSFKTIKHHIRGFKDDELRQHLVRAGAIAFEDRTRAKEGSDKVERWGLLSKNVDKLSKADDPD